MITITFDLDGVLCDLYGVPNWLEALRAEDTTPYQVAQPLVKLTALAKRLNNLQREGFRLAVCSWLSKGGSDEYNARVISAKVEWLARHLPSVHWDEVNIVPWGTPKEFFCYTNKDILFDDEAHNRAHWGGQAHTETEIFTVLKSLIQEVEL